MLNKIKIVTLLMLVLVQKTSYAQTERSVSIFPSTFESINDYYQNGWAVLIGINKFRYWNGLDYAIQDAEAMKEILVDEFGFMENQIILLTDQKATLKNIKQLLGDILKDRVRQNDQVLIFWAGHGETVDNPKGDETGYLIPFDGNKNFYSTCFSMDEIKTLANIIPAKHILFLIDACYSGYTTDQTRNFIRDISLKIDLETNLQNEVRQIIAAGTKGQKVYEKSLWGHSAFTCEIIKALKGRRADYDNDGIITATDLAGYLINNVPKISEGRQNPQYRIFSGKGEFVFHFKRKNAFSFDIVAPEIENRTRGKAKKNNPFLIQVLATDINSSVKNVQIEFRNSKDDELRKADMIRKPENRFEYEISKEYINSKQIKYSISAIDEFFNQRTIHGVLEIDNRGCWKWLLGTAFAAGTFYFLYQYIIPGEVSIIIQEN